MEERKAFKNLNISVFLHFVGRQAYSIFVPVILLKNSYPLSLVMVFLILSSVVTIVSSYLGQRIMAGKNVIYFNILAVLSEISLLLILIKSGFSTVAFLLLILFEGFYYAFYYLSYFAITMHYTSEETTGNNLGNLTITIALASITGPLIGAYILAGSKIKLITTAIGALLLSLIPILRIVKTDIEGLESEETNIGNIKKELINYSLMSSFEVVIFVLWGIYAYTNDFTLLSIGFIVVATSIARIAVSLSVKKKLVNQEFREIVMFFSVLGIIFTSIYRFYVPQNIIITNILMSLSYVGFQLGVQTSVINKMKGNRTYYSSMILQATTFSTRIPVYILTFFLGLKNIILLPVAFSSLYIILNIYEISLSVKYVLRKSI